MKRVYYLDTEFSEGFYKPISWLPGWLPFNKPRWNIELISIGITTVDGREYYAINKDFRLSRCNDWVKENVITKLPSRMIIDDNVSHDYYNIEQPVTWPQGLVKNSDYKSIGEIRRDIKNFVMPYDEISDHAGMDGIDAGIDRWLKQNTIVFKAYYADYDWVLFCTIFGTMMDLPKGYPMYCFDIKQKFDDFIDTFWWPESKKYMQGHLPEITFDEAVNKFKSLPEYPKEDNEHSAISDAKFNMQLDYFIDGRQLTL